MHLVAFSEKPLCLIDVLTATMHADGVSPGLDEASFPWIETNGPLSREDEAVLHTIIVGDPGTKIVLGKPGKGCSITSSHHFVFSTR